MTLSKKAGNRIVKCVAGVVGSLILAFLTMNLYVLLSTPKEYMITADNHIEYQSGYECSGEGRKSQAWQVSLPSEGDDEYCSR